MRSGMLWFDNDRRRTVSEKIVRAARYFTTKYGHAPTLCFVNPVMLTDGGARVDGITIRATSSVLPNHFWLGEEGKAEA